MGGSVVATGFGLLARGEVVEPPPWYEWVSAVFVLAVVLGWLIWTSIEILKLGRRRRPS
jgi:hypothetical protein